MAATFVWSESNLVGQVVEDDIANLNFGDIDDHELVPASYPIVCGECSYEKWLRAKFSDSFTEISNMKFWKSSGALKDDEVIYADLIAAFHTPVKTASIYAVTAVPTSVGTAITVLAANGDATIVAPGYTRYLCLQTESSVDTPAGAGNQKVFTIQYDEV